MASSKVDKKVKGEKREKKDKKEKKSRSKSPPKTKSSTSSSSTNNQRGTHTTNKPMATHVGNPHPDAYEHIPNLKARPSKKTSTRDDFQETTKAQTGKLTTSEMMTLLTTPHTHSMSALFGPAGAISSALGWQSAPFAMSSAEKMRQQSEQVAVEEVADPHTGIHNENSSVYVSRLHNPPKAVLNPLSPPPKTLPNSIYGGQRPFLVNGRDRDTGKKRFPTMPTLKVTAYVDDMEFHRPSLPSDPSVPTTPRMCRELGCTYGGQVTGSVRVSVERFYYEDDDDDDDDEDNNQDDDGITDGASATTQRVRFGILPTMVGSSPLCRTTSPTQSLTDMSKEDPSSFGSHFLINGNEKIVRLLQIQRKNHPLALNRAAFKNRGQGYTTLGVTVRCGKTGGRVGTMTNTVHYRQDGSVTLRILVKKKEVLLPVVVVLRALSNGPPSTSARVNDKYSSKTGITDSEIYERLVSKSADAPENTFLTSRVMSLLNNSTDDAESNPTTSLAALRYIGSKLRLLMPTMLDKELYPDEVVGAVVMQDYVLVNNESWTDKLNGVILLVKKVYSLASPPSTPGSCMADNPDDWANLEILTPGQVLAPLIVERVDDYVNNVRKAIMRDFRVAAGPDRTSSEVTADLRKFFHNVMNPTDEQKGYFAKMLKKSGSESVMSPIGNLLSTGNLMSTSGLDFSQITGYSVMADRLNYLRHISHYRSVHRGAFFTQMKTTEVRKLLGGGWGFLCPVHTPDGGPCGLLVHMSQGAEVITPRPTGGFDDAPPRGNAYLRTFWENDKVAREGNWDDHNQCGDDYGDDYAEEKKVGGVGDNGPNEDYIRALLASSNYQTTSSSKKAKKNSDKIRTIPYNLDKIREFLVARGLVPVTLTNNPILPCDQYFPCVVDGVIVGYGTPNVLEDIVKAVRRSKVVGLKWERDSVCTALGIDKSTGKGKEKGKEKGRGRGRGRGKEGEKENGTSGDLVIPVSTEVAYIPPSNTDNAASDTTAPFPGLYLFADNGPGGMGRVVRPVWYDGGRRNNVGNASKDSSQGIELIGGLEQAFVTVAINSKEKPAKLCSHNELSPTFMLSVLASGTPFSDYNQSPRNMYQCQMAKQTMGTACYNWETRADNKMFRVMTPQRPVVSTRAHRGYGFDEFPNGTNAVVAVVSYTGFDMEDAMILNKGSFDRGFGAGCVYKNFVVDLSEEGGGRGGGRETVERYEFNNVDGEGEVIEETLGVDGLPHVGMWVKEGDPIYSVLDKVTGQRRLGRHKEHEDACVQTVRLLNSAGGLSKRGATGNLTRISVTLRIRRPPVIGDKFSSRHGQKGVMSILWPHEDMPFSEVSGISPDIIINPHAFPSRMTIGMLIESMAGKSGALMGKTVQDSTPFNSYGKDGRPGDSGAVEHFAQELIAKGYHHLGSEPLYSGISGCYLQADLYMGVVYYQRLRHMVSDKSQVRATGAVNQLTRQPVKGRKRGGGIRLGEMERDSLLSHGCAFLLHDRLVGCSDGSFADVCGRCGGILTTGTERVVNKSAGIQSSDVGVTAAGGRGSTFLRIFCRSEFCRKVRSGKEVTADDPQVKRVAVPYVFRYLVNELGGMGVSIKVSL